MATRREIAVRLKAEVTDFKRQIGESGKALDTLAKAAGGAEKVSQTTLGRMAQSAQLQRDQWQAAGTALTAFGTVTVGALGVASKAAIDWESAWAGVTKTVDGSATELAGLEEGLRGMARELPAAHGEIASVAEAAGQLGIQTPAIEGFTRTMIDLGETTNLTADQAATSLARFANIMGTSQDDFSRLGSALVELGNNYATTEAEIMDMATRLASSGRQIGLTEGEVFGLATALSSVGIESEAGGTAFSRVMIEMRTAADTGGSSLEAFASTAGMSAEAFAQAFREDAGGAIAAFIQGLGDMEAQGESTQPVLDELGLADVRVGNALRSASAASDLFTDAMATGNEAFKANNALAAEAEKRYATVASQLQVTKNNIADAGISLGETFMPAISGASEAVADLAGWVSQLPDPLLTVSGALGAIGGTGALAAGGFALVFPRAMETYQAFQTLKDVSPGLASGLGKVGGAFKKIGSYGGTLAVAAVAAGAVGKATKEIIDAARGIDRTADGLEEVTNAITGASEAGQFYSAAFGEMADAGQINVGMFGDLADAAEAVANQNWADRFFGGLGMDATGVADVAKQFETWGEALAAMPLEESQAKFRAMWAEAGGSEVAGQNLLDSMPQYREAVFAAGNAAGVAGEDFDVLAWAAGDAGGAVEEFASDVDFTTDSLDRQIVSLEELLGLQREAAGVVMSAAEAEAAWAQQTMDNTEAVKELNGYVNEAGETVEGLGTAVKNGGAELDLFSEAGQLASETLLATADAGWANVEAAEANGASAEVLKAKTQEARDEFIRVAQQMGLTEDAANELADQYGLIPEKIQTEAELKKAQAERDLESLKAKLNSLPNPVISISTVGYAQSYAYLQSLQGIANSLRNNPVRIATGAGGAGGVTFADGGPVFGPGTSTSDSIPARLSNGEYVIKADSVQRYGRSFFDAVNAQRFATGGMVGGGSVSAPVSGAVVNYNQNGPVYATDPQAVARASVARLRDAMSGAGLTGVGGF